MPLPRTMLFVPGSRPNMIEKAKGLSPDALILDLEDSVSEGEKQGARELVGKQLAHLQSPRRELWVRVNSTYTGLAKDDIRAVVQPGLAGIMLPKANTPETVRYCEALLRDAEAMAGIDAESVRIIAVIETAVALLHIEAISLASTRLTGLAFGAEDFTADMQIERTASGDEIAYARHAIAVASRAAGIAAIDSVYPFLGDIEGLLRDARVAKQAGFHGKQLIHPEQIEPVAGVFSPTREQLDQARRIVDAYRQAVADGRGAVQVDGLMVDAPVAKRAKNLIEAAETG